MGVSPDPAPARILVVDVDRRVRRALTRILERDGYVVGTAVDGSDARRRLVEARFDAVVCDVTHSQASDPDLASWLRHHRPDVPVVLVADRETPGAATTSSGIGDTVVGPFHPTGLTVAVPAVLSRRRQVAELHRGIDDLALLVDRVRGERDAAVAALGRQERLWAALLASTGIGVALLRHDGSVEHTNPRGAELLGCTAGSSWLDSIETEDRAAAAALLDGAPGGVVSTDLALRTPSGERRHLIVRGSTVEPGGGPGAVVLSIEDRSELVEINERLERERSLDAATGLPNRASLAAHLEALLAGRASAAISVIGIELAGLRDLARVEGAVERDRVMTVAAAAIRDVLGPGDVVGRSGSTAFAVVTTVEEPAAVLATLPAAVVRALGGVEHTAGRAVELDPRIGIAVAESGATAESLMCDAALASEHVSAARGVRVFNETLRTEAAERFELERHLRTAIDRGGLSLEYQPIVGAVDRRVVGLEALSRWQHPVLGRVPPQRFIPVAEQIGLGAAMGDHVLRSSVDQIAVWDRITGRDDLWVSCNVSPPMLEDVTLPDRIARLLDSAGVDPARLCVEVTEESMISGVRGRRTLADLRRHGVRLALDDFGTGYSSLAYLIDVEFDVLKLAGDLMPPRDGSRADDTGRQVLQTVVTMARSLGLAVVAEAVETEAQWAQIVECGADLVQGWAFAPSLPPGSDELLGMLGGFTHTGDRSRT